MNQFEGVGTDIIEIDRIEMAIKRHGKRFLETIFTEKERAYCDKYAHPIPHFAGRFAAKEAVLKALGTGIMEGIVWHDIEILNAPSGKPEVHLSPRLLRKMPDALFLLSISHSKNYATAIALLGKE